MYRNSLTESMVSDFDSGGDNIYAMMANRRAGKVPARKATVSQATLMLDDQEIASPFNNSIIYNHREERRRRAQEEEEKLRRLGFDEYNRQSGVAAINTNSMLLYGNDEDGSINNNVLELMNRKMAENMQITHGAQLNGNLETDESFLETADTRDLLTIRAPVNNKKQKPKEYILSKSIAVEIPLSADNIEKINVFVDYSSQKDNKAELHISKYGKNKDKISMKIDINGDGKKIENLSAINMFKAENGYDKVSVTLKGNYVTGASLSII